MTDAALDALTNQQLIAAGSPLTRVYIEAAPGSGKTTVSAYRFGAQRFAVTSDRRAVVAVSFTRSATAELRSRVRQLWGRAAISPPHRIVTLDTIICDLLTHLLCQGVLRWPGGHTELEVSDTWSSRYSPGFTFGEPQLILQDNILVPAVTYHPRRGNYVSLHDFTAGVNEGRCTHSDVRAVLELAWNLPDVSACLTEYLAATTRALIIDEIFDANDLDLHFVELAAAAGVSVTVVGDPWQALYGFRGARPDLVPRLIEQADLTELQLSRSFRWRTPEQEALATALREREPITVQVGPLTGVDAVLAREWKPLWDIDPDVLPLAFRSATGNVQEAASTLLLNQLTRAAFGERAVYTNDALTTLQLDADAHSRLEPLLDEVLAALVGPQALDTVLDALHAAVTTESPRTMPGRHHSHRTRLRNLRARARRGTDNLIPGLTTHQAKGREWDAVAVHLKPGDAGALRLGLDQANEDHRKVYVALTRARSKTIAVDS
ncbi:UvrD-helicase domain-containing protein [Kitasatospora sp. NPDC048407]|uniref:UvrD-helicase domain-containing protein n=1 Tax=Kitasatospora sp. NPDC048407 TaxID=3364051 RepID=UPI0037220B1C